MAQEPSIALNQYEHTMSGDAFFAVPSPAIGGHLVPRGMLTFDYARNPLVLVDANDVVVTSPVTSQAHLHVGFSLALWNRLMASVDMPIAVLQSGDDSSGALIQSAQDASPGDLRLGLRGNIYGDYYDPFQIGVGAYLYTPTGGDTGFTGEGTIYGQPHLLLGGRTEFLVYSAKAGAIVRGSENPSTFTYGIGAAALFLDEKLQIGPEAYGQIAFKNDAVFADQVERTGEVNTEFIVGAQYYFLDMFVAGAGAGAGLARGIGTPQFRALARFAYAPRPDREKPPEDRDGDGIFDADDACPDTKGAENADPKKHGCPPDRDGDGILDNVDACPDTPGVNNDDPSKHGCPPPGDRDGDGIIDPVDACPDVPGVASDDASKNGCPADRDGDGVIDANDACPDVPGVRSDDPKKNGCPGDRDGDGIVDADDACPDKPGSADPNPAKHGCPKVVVTEKEILILQKVAFDFDKATIKPVSSALLDEVAQTLNDNPDIQLIEVQGHTDNKGGMMYNIMLSDNRAKAVKDALIARKVDAKRLRAKGFGPKQPIASNDTDEGRSKNRRVQFKIIKRAKP